MQPNAAKRRNEKNAILDFRRRPAKRRCDPMRKDTEQEVEVDRLSVVISWSIDFLEH
jgi:hypothetical protein